MISDLRPGYRKFICPECSHEWQEATRDFRSMSGEACSKCGEWTTPSIRWVDLSLPVDEYGNLTS